MIPSASGKTWTEVFEELTSGSDITLLVARNNAPVELTGRYEPKMVTRPPRAVFDRTRPSGRVDVTRSGNTVTAVTRGVGGFTLLISPDQFDFSKPISVVANGKTVFDRESPEGSGDADEVRGRRQRSDDALRRRGARRSDEVKVQDSV